MQERDEQKVTQIKVHRVRQMRTQGWRVVVPEGQASDLLK